MATCRIAARISSVLKISQRLESRKFVLDTACKQLDFESRIFDVSQKHISTTRSNYLKEVKVSTEGDVTTVEGNYLTSDGTDNLIPQTAASDLAIDDVRQLACPLCRLDLQLHYSDVLILNQFVRADGEVLPRTVTGVCYTQQCRLKKRVHQAKTAGLMPHHKPDLAEGEPDPSTYKYKQYNVYFKEDS